MTIIPDEEGGTWEEYQFNCKPGDVKRRPCLISPYHYRLDWLMWFAAFQVQLIDSIFITFNKKYLHPLIIFHRNGAFFLSCFDGFRGF